MREAELERFEVDDPIHGRVPCAVLPPAGGATARGLCLFLYGGGGSRETLAEVAPLLHAWQRDAGLPPLLIATPDVGPWSFYLDDPARGLGWERFVTERFVGYVRQAFGAAALSCGAVGISMGGYGALKIAFARPTLLAAVAAVSPMVEPAFEASQVQLRNRYHYPAQVPQALLGADRDAELYRVDHPAGRARHNAAALRASGLAVYIDAAGDDALHAHDGAEHLHRLLWDLDLPHEYRLRRDSDHVGPDLLARLQDAFAWVGERLVPSERDAPDFGRAALRAQLEPLRREAALRDPTFDRRCGVLRD